MKKQEALNHIKQIRGFVPYVTFFDIFEDDDEIPQHLIDISIQEEKNKRPTLIMSAQGAEHFNKAMESYNSK